MNLRLLLPCAFITLVFAGCSRVQWSGSTRVLTPKYFIRHEGLNIELHPARQVLYFKDKFLPKRITEPCILTTYGKPIAIGENVIAFYGYPHYGSDPNPPNYRESVYVGTETGKIVNVTSCFSKGPIPKDWFLIGEFRQLGPNVVLRIGYKHDETVRVPIKTLIECARAK